MRRETDTAPSELTRSLEAARPPEPSHDYWVARGRRNVLARARALVRDAARSVQVDSDELEALADELAAARGRDCRVIVRGDAAPGGAGLLRLPVDDIAGLVGTLAPEDYCQAVVSSNPALVGVLRDTRPRPAAPGAPAPTWAGRDPLAWVRWEDQKRLRLLQPDGGTAA